MSLINNSTLNYTNTKTIANDDSIFINTNNSTVNLLTGTTVTSTNKKVTGVYSEKSNVTNAGTLTLTGDNSSGIYAKSGSVVNQATGKITVGKDGSGIYVMATGTPPVPATGTNLGEIEIGQGSVGMRAENSTITNGATGKITSSGISATGMSQSVGSQDITNNGTITLTGDKSTALHSEGITTANHKVINTGDITVGDSSNELTPSVGIYSANGTNSTVESSGNVGQIGIAMRKGAILTNNGTIHIDATKGYGLFLAGAIVKNYGTANITTGSGATPIKEVTAADTSKEMQDIQDGINKVKIHSPEGAAEAKIIANGRVQTPTVVHVQAIPNRKPNDIPTSSIGMYVDTSGINYTRPITNIGALRGLTQSDLIIGVEATKYTTSKYIQLGQDIIEPYNDMIRTSGIEKWNIYSSSLTWMASITQLPDYTIRNAYLAKVPYTVWAGRMSTPVDKKDTYNFLDGLEQRYGVEGIGTRENQVFQKINGIGNNEEILFFQAIDEMMGHQYANTQQRVQATGIILDKEFKYLRDEWRTASKDSNKIKTFGTNGEYKTDTAGVIDYKNNAYGVAYENELGRVANGKNKARVVDTTADWFNIRGEKEDRKGNVKVDLNVGVDNTRVGVTANVGYDTKGENLRGGLGLRVIF